VFLPLCGKTLDIHWLLTHSCRVASPEFEQDNDLANFPRSIGIIFVFRSYSSGEIYRPLQLCSATL
jgi:hypothetical protein